MRTMMLVGCIFLGACGGGGGGSGTDAASPDAAPPDAEAPGANTVTLQVQASGTPYLAYRNGAGAWRPMKHLANGNYAMYVTNDYRYIVACADAGGFDAEMYARTWADGASQFGFCSPLAARRAPLANVTVTGQMVQPGTVWVGTSDTGATSPWSFSISTPAGTHDVFGVSADHIAIRRAVSIPTDTTLPDIDVDQEGSPLDLLPLTINGLGTDQPSVRLTWFAATDYVDLPGTPTQLIAPPAAMVNANDFEFAQVDDFVGSTDRAGLEFVSGTPSTTYDMMPLLAGVSFVGTGEVAARFGTLPPAYDDLTLTLFDSGNTSEQRFDASQSWIDATGVTEIGWDSAPSDYNPSWQLLGAAAAFRDFSAFHSVGTIFYNTSVLASALRATDQHHRDIILEHAARQAGRVDPRIERR